MRHRYCFNSDAAVKLDISALLEKVDRRIR